MKKIRISFILLFSFLILGCTLQQSEYEETEEFDNLSKENFQLNDLNVSDERIKENINNVPVERTNNDSSDEKDEYDEDWYDECPECIPQLREFEDVDDFSKAKFRLDDLDVFMDKINRNLYGDLYDEKDRYKKCQYEVEVSEDAKISVGFNKNLLSVKYNWVFCEYPRVEPEDMRFVVFGLQLRNYSIFVPCEKLESAVDYSCECETDFKSGLAWVVKKPDIMESTTHYNANTGEKFCSE